MKVVRSHLGSQVEEVVWLNFTIFKGFDDNLAVFIVKARNFTDSTVVCFSSLSFALAVHVILLRRTHILDLPLSILIFTFG